MFKFMFIDNIGMCVNCQSLGVQLDKVQRTFTDGRLVCVCVCRSLNACVFVWMRVVLYLCVSVHVWYVFMHEYVRVCVHAALYEYHYLHYDVRLYNISSNKYQVSYNLIGVFNCVFV